MTNAKYCTACAHCLPGANGLAYSRCAKAIRDTGDHFVAPELAETQYLYCATERLNSSGCGPDAKLFEPKGGVQ